MNKRNSIAWIKLQNWLFLCLLFGLSACGGEKIERDSTVEGSCEQAALNTCASGCRSDEVCCGNTCIKDSSQGIENAPTCVSDTPTCTEAKFELCGKRCFDATPTLSNLQEGIFMNSCGLSSSCHSGARPQEDLDHSTQQSTFEGVVGKSSKQRPSMNLVEPGNPEASYLINKISCGDIEAASTGGEEAVNMPKSGTPLCQAKIDAIKEWILQGAQNN